MFIIDYHPLHGAFRLLISLRAHPVRHLLNMAAAPSFLRFGSLTIADLLRDVTSEICRKLQPMPGQILRQSQVK
jgi:hypothetical protein